VPEAGGESNIIRARSLRVDYEDVTAVRDVDLEVRAGEIYGLVGPNGAGKTSTIKALAGILEPTYGEVVLGGADMELAPEEGWKRLGYVPDFPPVYENLRVWEYLDVFAAAQLIPRGEGLARAREWVERLDLAGKWDSFVRDLSRGMRQRLVLAKTLLHRPSILLLDEPAGGMDPIARVELRRILEEFAAEGAAVLISSHILTELSGFCTAIGVMEKGRMVASGTVDEIRAQVGSKGEIVVRLAPHEADPVRGEPPRAALRRALEESGVVREIRDDTAVTVRGQFAGGDAEAAELLAKIVAAGVPVADFHVEKEDIEDIFLKIGAREVS
jgi:ABC-2 type transport system ATP-binding protein